MSWLLVISMLCSRSRDLTFRPDRPFGHIRKLNQDNEALRVLWVVFRGLRLFPVGYYKPETGFMEPWTITKHVPGKQQPQATSLYSSRQQRLKYKTNLYIPRSLALSLSLSVCMHACMDGCSYVCAYVCMYACLYVPVCACLCICVCMYVRMCLRMYVYIYIYTH